MFLVSNSIQVAGLTPPYVFLARDKFKMNVLESSIDGCRASSRASAFK
jgi:hypothetical protein